MNKLFQILILLLAASCSYAQNDSFRLVRRFQANVVQLAVDHLDYLYIVSPTDGLKKLNDKGDSVAVYNQVKRFGKLRSIDVTNPLKVLLYYKDFSTIILLDRLLSLRAVIDLRKLNIIQTSAVCLTYDGNIWLFDEYENKLKKISEEGSLLFETPDFRTIFPEAILPQQIIDQNGTLYLYDARAGLYLFDYYGSFKKKLPVTGWQSIAVWNQYITGISHNSFHYYDTVTLMSGMRKLPTALPGFDNLQLANNKLFSWTPDSVSIYNYPL